MNFLEGKSLTLNLPKNKKDWFLLIPWVTKSVKWMCKNHVYLNVVNNNWLPVVTNPSHRAFSATNFAILSSLKIFQENMVIFEKRGFFVKTLVFLTFGKPDLYISHLYFFCLGCRHEHWNSIITMKRLPDRVWFRNYFENIV